MGLLTFKGGLHPYDGKELSKDQPIKEYLPQGDLVFPLSQHIGAPAKACVKKNDRVLVGQKIAEGCREQLQKLRGTYTLFAVPVIADCTLEDAGISVEDYMQRIPGQSFTLYFFYAPEEDQEPDTGVLASELQNMLLKMPFIHGVVKAYFTSEETLRLVQEYMESVPEPGFDLMEITENAAVLERPYQDGAVQITEEDLMKVLCR